MKKIAIILLAALLTGIVSCGDSGKTDDAQTSGKDTTAPEKQIEYPNYGGYNIRVLTRDDGGTGAWITVDVLSAEENGDTINDAVYRRNQTVSENYNVTFERIPALVADHITMVSQSVLAGDDSFDFVLSHLSNSANMSMQGLLLLLNDLENLDLSKSCWDIAGNNSTMINGRIYYAMGDINITDNDATYSVLFNKEIAAEYSEMPDLYQLVRDGKWTLDKMKELSIMATKDVDGNNTLEWDKDRWGVLDQYEVGIALLFGSGERICKLDNDGFLVYNLDNEKIVNAFEKIYNHFADRSYHLIADHTKYASVTDLWNTLARGSFKSGRALFFSGPIVNISLIRDMETDFGILPIPKLYDTQDKYYSMLQSGNATSYSIPITATEPERNATILQALCELSTDTLMPAYYENTIKRKASRDAESWEMLDIIFENRIVDLSNAYTSIGTNAFLINTLKAASNTFTSSEASSRQTFIENIKKINDAYAAN